MLPCMEDEEIQPFLLAFSDDRAHFDDFRAGSEDDGDFHITISFDVLEYYEFGLIL